MARVQASLVRARAAVTRSSRKPRPELPVKARRPAPPPAPTKPAPPTPPKGKPTK